MKRYWDVLEEQSQADRDLQKKAEMSLREAGTNASPFPIVIKDGKVCHPDLNDRGELKKRKK